MQHSNLAAKQAKPFVQSATPAQALRGQPPPAITASISLTVRGTSVKDSAPDGVMRTLSSMRTGGWGGG